ncbi:hypothetical protein JD844_022979 [Phrynosoma platyrhinos]|uniref:DnaJ homolog subfamily C member 10 n=1 Tax=Phrynosoma platyrhinos TaxID=52577 RepID=A0ABQ7SW64_PHRPL|nr:hypothetical protein JD844_022979 [Phrynosoma platyrhinos]
MLIDDIVDSTIYDLVGIIINPILNLKSEAGRLENSLYRLRTFRNNCGGLIGHFLQPHFTHFGWASSFAACENDPEAHDNFLKINRAYEVLKDEDLRKKYDKYGEKGLEDHQEGGRYESWHFYRYDFGIYDDDPEIITLDRGEFVKFLTSLDAKEIYLEVMQHIPDFKMISASTLKVGKFDCLTALKTCNDLYVYEPCVVVFKGRGLEDYEIHHGKKILYDIVAFAKESVNSHVITLGPQNFPGKEKEPWLVDFFAPWCPPCRALLPELRKASKQLYGQLKFGTLDCTIHEGICNMDLMNPSVVSLTPETFNELVKKRKENEVWVVDFYAPWCGPCQALMPEWKRMARLLNGLVTVGSVDCQKYFSLCHQESVQGYPEIRLFPQKSVSSYQYYSYSGWHRDAYSLRRWALGYLPQVSLDLSPQSFTDKVLNGKDHWVIDFYAPWCGPCQSFAPEFEILAKTVKRKVKAGKVDCQAHAHICQSAGIRAYPTVKFYPYHGTKKNEFGENIDSLDVKAIAEQLMVKVEEIKKKKKSSRKKVGNVALKSVNTDGSPFLFSDIEVYRPIFSQMNL